MKPISFTFLNCGWILAIMLLVGCEVKSVSPNVSATSVSIPQTEMPTSTPALISSMAPPTPTLTSEQIRVFVVNALQESQSCKLPCWWTIVPGITDWETVRSTFAQQGIHWLESGDHGGMALNVSYPDFPNPFTYRVDIEFTAKNNLVQSILINSEGGLRSNHFAKDWRLYSLKETIGQYGQPTAVYLAIALPHEQGANTFYTLSVFYQQQGIAIGYGGVADTSGANIRICPALEHTSNIQLWLQSPTSETNLEKAIISPDTRPYIHSLEEATGISLTKFTQVFTGTNKGECLDTPVNLWP